MFRTRLLALTLASCALAFTAFSAVDKATESLQATLKQQIQGHEALAPNVKAFVQKSLLPSTVTAAWVKAVEAQNAKKIPLEEIQAIDKKWIAAEEELPIQKALMSNPCADAIRALAKSNPAILEAFVMDNQGANVCQNALTSDYWQGDEAKWKNSFNGGKGGVDVGKISFDKSANAQLQQVSLPIIGQGGKVIGAITFGLAVSSL